jgi:flavin-binding protein dodecin
LTTFKIIELVGSSPNSWEDAVKQAVREASKTINGLHGVDVVNQTAIIENDGILEYRANVKLAFKVNPGRTNNE